MKIISQEIALKKLLDRDLHLYFIYLFIFFFQANDLSLILVLKSGIVFAWNVLDIECIHVVWGRFVVMGINGVHLC